MEHEIVSNKWIYILGSILCINYVIPYQQIRILISAVVFFSAWIFKLCNTTLLLLVSSTVLTYEGSSIIRMIALLPAFISKINVSMKLKASQVIFICFFLCSILISFALGENPNINTLIIFIMCIFLYYNTFQYTIEVNELEKYAFFGIASVCFALVIALQSGDMQIIYGRLAINDNIRSLANAISIPLVILLFTYFEGRGRKKSRKLKIIFIGISSVILLLTFSRGAIIAVLVALSVMMLWSNISLPKKLLFILLLLLTIVITINYLGTDSVFRVKRLLETEVDGLNGRFEIWSAYWEVMKTRIPTLLFGFGPGDVRRLSILNSYSHSVILDVLYSYGICGFLLFTLMILSVLRKCVISKNNLIISIFIFALLLFSTHSTSTNTSFYIIIGVVYALSSQSIFDSETEVNKISLVS